MIPLAAYTAAVRSPVALLIFNRPELTRRVFAAIREAKPKTLFLVADGPRATHADDAERCAAARVATETIDWECDVRRHYSDRNLGCRERVSSGLDWIFEQVEEAIILEDDCLPHPTFFRFADELLERYRDDERIMVVGGNNFQRAQRDDASYYYSIFPQYWGWATWRRAWRRYDHTMARWPAMRDGGWLRDILPDGYAAAYWRRVMEATARGENDSWGYRWTFTCWAERGLTIVPRVNLVTNAGFGDQSTHTRALTAFANVPAVPMQFPLRHPPLVVPDTRADAYTQKLVVKLPRPVRAVARWLGRVRY